MGRTTTGSVVLAALFLAAQAAGAQAIARPRDSALVARAMQFPSPRAATWMAAGAALSSRTQGGSGTALWATGVLAGPMIGDWYGGTLSASWSGAVLRTGALAIAAAGASGCGGGTRSLSGCSAGEETAMLGGAVLAVGSAVYEIITVGA